MGAPPLQPSPCMLISQPTSLACTSTQVAHSLADMQSSFLVGALRMARTTGSLPTLGMSSGVTTALSRLPAAATSVALRAKCRQELPEQPLLCKQWSLCLIAQCDQNFTFSK